MCKREFVWLGTGILESSEEVSDSAELCSASFEQSSITREISNRNLNCIAVIILQLKFKKIVFILIGGNTTEGGVRQNEFREFQQQALPCDFVGVSFSWRWSQTQVFIMRAAYRETK
jgi:hypothetical protein